jgi:exopolysaccharide biosynthesis polyprenyl glycosylphosphotransferase
VYPSLSVAPATPTGAERPPLPRPRKVTPVAPVPAVKAPPATAKKARSAAARKRRTAAIGTREMSLLLTLDAAAVAAVAAPSWVAVVVQAALTVGALAVVGLYRARLQLSLLDDLSRIVLAVAAAAAGSAWIGAVFGSAAPAVPVGGAAGDWAAAILAAVVIGRLTGYGWIRRHRRRSPGRATIVVGTGGVALRLADALRDDRRYGLAPVGFVGPQPLTRLTLPILAPAADLEKAVARYKPLHLIVTFPDTPDADLVATLRRCRRYGVTVHVVPRLFELAVGRERPELLRGIPLARLGPDPAHLRRWPVKRLIDVFGAALGLILLAPVLALCALAVRWESGRHGVLFRQERIGRDGKPFTILKFRSLTPASDLESQVTWNINTDARLGPVGRVLRASSLDELPQLLNVLRGDMSLVGPRPERPFFVDEFERTYAGYGDRHRTPAGITGWAQVNGLRGDTSIEDRVRFDNHYIEHWSLGLDIKIMLRTLGTMLSKHR